MADNDRKQAVLDDASDEDIVAWWNAERQSGLTDKDIQRRLISAMLESYKGILLELDAVQLRRFETEGFPHWFGAYRPMFPETGQGSDGSGALRLDALCNELESIARSDVTDPVKRMRALYRTYLRAASGEAERSEMLTMALASEWLPVAGLRTRSGGPRTGPNSAQGKSPIPLGASGGNRGSGGPAGSGGRNGSGGNPPYPVAPKKPRITINLLKPKAAGQLHPKIVGVPDAKDASALARERIQANRFATRSDVEQVYVGDKAREQFKSPSGKFADVVARKIDGSHALGEGKGTDMAKLVEQFTVTGAKVGRVSEQEVVIEKLTPQTVHNSDGSVKETFNSPGPNGRLDAQGYLEVFDTKSEKWVRAMPNGVPIKVVVRQ